MNNREDFDQNDRFVKEKFVLGKELLQSLIFISKISKSRCYGSSTQMVVEESALTSFPLNWIVLSLGG